MKWVTVETCSLSEGEVLKNMLQSYGIPARLSYESSGRVLGLVGEGLGPTQVQVPADRQQEAHELLEAPPAEE